MKPSQNLFNLFHTFFKQRVEAQGFAQVRTQGAKESHRRSTVATTISQVLKICEDLPLTFTSWYRLGHLCKCKDGVRVGRARVGHVGRAEVLNSQGVKQAIPLPQPCAALLKDFDTTLEGMIVAGCAHAFLEGIEAADGGLQ